MVSTRSWTSGLLLLALSTSAAVTEAERQGERECNMDLSARDRANGIRVYTDLTCWFRSRTMTGCVQNYCRLCKVRSTPQSDYLLNCADLGFASVTPTPAPTPRPTPPTQPPTPAPTPRPTPRPTQTPTPSPTPRRTPRPTQTPTPAPTPRPTPSPTPAPTPQPTPPPTPAPTPPPTPPPTTASTPPPTPPPTPAPTTDPVTLSPQEVTNPPTGPPSVCDSYLLNYDLPPGFVFELDAQCLANPAWQMVICVDSCRACWPTMTPTVATYVASMGDILAQCSWATQAPTPPPTQPNADPFGCAALVSDGDKNVGVSAISDTACASGGVGCFSDVCRFCKTSDTPQSGHLWACSAGPAPPSAPTTAPSQPPVTSSPTAPPANDPSGCAAQVTDGDNNVGISALTDPTCVDGGVGCFSDVCRFCKTRDTPQSGHLSACSGGAAATLAPTTAPTQPPATSAPTPPPANDLSGCARLVSNGDKAVGISAYTDAACTSGGVGCFSDVCRYCKTMDTPQSGHLLACADGPAPPASTPAPTPAPTAAPTPAPATGCAAAVSDGDRNVGVYAMTDASCASGGVGCFSDVCRFCKTMDTPQSSHLLPCPGASTNAPPPPPPLLLAAKGVAMSTTEEFTELIQKSPTFKWAAMSSALVGVAAVLALAVIVVRRVVRSGSAQAAGTAVQTSEAEENETEVDSEAVVATV